MGVPIDSVNIDNVIAEIDNAARIRQPILISTVNTNFLINSQTNAPFRLSLLVSDLCTVDGIGMLMVCRLLSSGALARTSGADVLERLWQRAQSSLGRPLRVFFFGGASGVAEAARRKINQDASPAICCVGALNPGFGSMEDMSRVEILRTINDANPDFLIVALGAERGQAWLTRNRDKLKAPVCAHLGAAVNFVAGTIERAPPHWRALGLEWLWRIGQEPHLIRRYWHDGRALLALLVTNVAPSALVQGWDRLRLRARPRPLRLYHHKEPDHHPGHHARHHKEPETLVIRMEGAATGDGEARLDASFRLALAQKCSVSLDVTGLCAIDTRAIGAIMRLRRDLEAGGYCFNIRGLSSRIALRLHLHGVEWMT